MGREAPRSVNQQIDRLVEGFRNILGDNLRGIYLHGSLALGCFNPACSDIDALVVVREPLDTDTKFFVADLLLHVSCAPYPVELHVVTQNQLDDWHHPSPFEVHCGEVYREAFALDPLTALQAMAPTDRDLAPHVAIAREAGIELVGPPKEKVFPEVPFTNYRDALGNDLAWARDVRSALYGILSPCRVWATLETGALHSKASGAAWALERLPEDLKPLVETALASYKGAGEPIDFDESIRQRLLDYIETRLPQ